MPANFSPMSEAGELSVTVYRQTCDMNTFRSGVADRGASIRIPLPVQLKGYGYLEDRRPAANVSPLPATDLLEFAWMRWPVLCAQLRSHAETGVL